jgi:DNA repair exonuclease SbcCD ATPase subunit
LKVYIPLNALIKERKIEKMPKNHKSMLVNKIAFMKEIRMMMDIIINDEESGFIIDLSDLEKYGAIDILQKTKKSMLEKLKEFSNLVKEKDVYIEYLKDETKVKETVQELINDKKTFEEKVKKIEKDFAKYISVVNAVKSMKNLKKVQGFQPGFEIKVLNDHHENVVDILKENSELKKENKELKRKLQLNNKEIEGQVIEGIKQLKTDEIEKLEKENEELKKKLQMDADEMCVNVMEKMGERTDEIMKENIELKEQLNQDKQKIRNEVAEATIEDMEKLNNEIIKLTKQRDLLKEKNIKLSTQMTFIKNLINVEVNDDY